MATKAVATREQRNVTPIEGIRQQLGTMAPEFRAALPAHVTVEKFTRVAMTAIQNTPELVNVDRRSLFGAIVRLAQDGLLPDGREAAIVKFGDKAQAMPMIAGILKKIRQSGEVAKVNAFVVHEKDDFTVRYGFDESVEHVPPPLDQPRGKPIGAYATAVLTDGSQLLEVMSLEEIEKVRKVSRASTRGPWVDWWGEMARKTVMRRLSKRLPMSTDLEEEVFQRDETLARNDTPVIEGEASNVTPIAPPANRLEALEAAVVDATPAHDPETGELALEGPADADRGEAVTLADAERALAEAQKTGDAAQVSAVVQSYAGQLGEEDHDALATAATDVIAAMQEAE